MMNILVTGCNGFLGTELAQHLSKDNNILAADRTILDPRNIDNVRNIFSNNKIDVVIHTAIKGGRRGIEEDIEVFFDNIKMFDNLASQRDKYKLMINFGSGAEFDRSKNIHLKKEEEVFAETPKDYYGLSKNLITRKILSLNSNIINLRLFGCFGPKEQEQRLLKNALNNFNGQRNAVIHQDKFMDYFFIQDCSIVVKHAIDNFNKLQYKDYNLCYNNKHKLSDLVNKLKSGINSSQNIDILERSFGLNYTGDSSRLDEMKLELNGLERGIEKYIKHIAGA